MLKGAVNIDTAYHGRECLICGDTVASVHTVNGTSTACTTCGGATEIAYCYDTMTTYGGIASASWSAQTDATEGAYYKWTANGTSWSVCDFNINSNQVATGGYMLLKYRLPVDTTNATTDINFYLKSTTVTSLTAFTAKGINDGKWHVAVIDVSKMGDKIYFIRFPYNIATKTIDVQWIAFTGSADYANKYSAGFEGEDLSSLNYFMGNVTISKKNKFSGGSYTLGFDSDTATNYTTFSSTNTSFNFPELAPNAEKAVTGQYIVLKYRLAADAGVTSIKAQVNGSAAANTINSIPVISDGQWHVVVIDAGDLAKDANGDYVITGLRLPYCIPTSIDIAWVGLTEDASSFN